MMMKKIFLSVAATLAMFTAQAQFNYRLPLSNYENGYHVLSLSGGGYLLTGYSNVNSGDVLVVKITSTGGIDWVHTYGSATVNENGYSAAETSTGDYVIVGYSGVAESTEDALVMYVTSTGTLSWAKTFGTAGAVNEHALSIVSVPSSNDYIITGQVYTAGTGYDAFVVSLSATSSSASFNWQKRYGTTGTDYGRSVDLDPSGNIIVTGNTGSGSDMLVFKTGSTGTLSWAESISSATYDEARSIRALSDGSFVMCGYSQSGNEFLGKLSSTGSISWQKEISGAGTAYAVCQTSDGGYVTSGQYGYLVKYDNTGSLSWSKRHLNLTGTTLAYGMAVTASDECVYSGYTYTTGMTNSDLFVVKTDASGNSCGSNSAGLSASSGGLSVTSLSWTPANTSYTLTAKTYSTSTPSGSFTSDCCTANAGTDKHDTYCGTSVTPVTIGTAAIAGLSYSWSPTTALTPPYTNAQVSAGPLPSDCAPYLSITYTVTVSGSGCMTNTDAVVVTPVMAAGCGGGHRMAAPGTRVQWSLYPNPSDGTLMISTGDDFSGTVTISIRDLTGRILLEKQTSAGQSEAFDLSAMTKGVYIVQIGDGQNTQSAKFVLQ